MLNHVFVFDLGKVLLDFDYSIAVRRLAARSKAGPEVIQSFIGATPLLLAYEEGAFGTEHFYRQVQAETGFNGNLDDFRNLFADIFTPIEPMIAFHAACREAGHETYIFSNTNELAIDFIRPRFPFFSRFDAWILSYECRSMKPAPGMYDKLEELSKRSSGHIVYMDDRQENVETALQRGWKGFVHTDPTETIREASRFVGL